MFDQQFDTKLVILTCGNLNNVLSFFSIDEFCIIGIGEDTFPIIKNGVKTFRNGIFRKLV